MVLTFISPSQCYATAMGDKAKIMTTTGGNLHNKTVQLLFFNSFKMVQSPVNEKKEICTIKRRTL